MKCSFCEHGVYLQAHKAYVCIHPKNKEMRIFNGKLHPQSCPLIKRKGYEKQQIIAAASPYSDSLEVR